MTVRHEGLATAETKYRDLTLKAQRYKLFTNTPAQLRDDGLIDPVAVDRVLGGYLPRPRITPRELVIIVYEGVRWGMTDTEIAALFGDGCSARLIKDLRKRNNVPNPSQYDDDYLCKLIVDPSARKQASAGALRAAGISELVAA